ncbi:MAG TPA: glycosyltransferase family 4 protein [Thermodesulfobacteriota bacterium]|nr:glycosyltransferase family 4 protein [Thermodesulfobacteriota bacterium]
MSKTVTYYIDSKYFGGAEQVLYTLLKGLDRNVWDPVLFYHPYPGISEFIKEIEDENIKTIPTPEIRSLSDLGSIIKLTSALKDIRPDIFHANLNWPLSCNYGITAAFLARVNIILATQHLFPGLTWWRERLEQKLVSFIVDTYIAVSNDVARQMREIITPGDKVEVVHNGIIIENYESEGDGTGAREAFDSIRRGRENSPVVLTVARLDKQKGHTYLLRAAADVPGALFVFAGDGPERAGLEKEAQELRLSDRVIFLGQRNDVRELLLGCDLFVLPSLFEGLPLSVMEAMAAGKPVIASNIGGVNELIRDGETGCLVPPGDTDALSRSINALISDPALSRKMAIAGRTLVEKEFSSASMVSGVTEIYKRHLSKRSQR